MLQLVDSSSMAYKPQSEEISKKESINFLIKFSTMKRLAFLSPEGFFEGDTFGCMLCKHVCECVYV